MKSVSISFGVSSSIAETEASDGGNRPGGLGRTRMERVASD
jgi:hypothetical protein